MTRYSILGPLAVDRDGQTLGLGAHLQRALLALLVTERGRTVSVDRITEELWGDEAPEDPAGSIQTYVSRLRRVLEPDRPAGATPTVLVRAAHGYRLQVPAEAVDVERFTALCAQAGRALADDQPAEALAAADAALGLWREDEALTEFGDRRFVEPVRARLADQRAGVEEDRAAALLALGRLEDTVLSLEAITRARPLRERPWLLLMTALDATGRTAEALAAYQRLHDLLDEELGLVPGPALRDLHVRILRRETPAPAPAPPVARSFAAHRGAQAPAEAGLVGRQAEYDRLAAVLTDLDRAGPRFMLVEGEAGIGKTRLVAEVTADAQRAGATVVWGRCHEDGDAPALWPWRQALAALSGPEQRLAADGFAAFEEVMARLVEAAQSRSVVVALDDLHWSDAASLRLLAFLATELGSARIAILATARDDAPGDALRRTIVTLSRTPGFVRVALRPLTAANTASLVSTVLGGPADASAAATIHARSGGNPFYATELARFLAEHPDEPQALPASVRDLVLGRVDRLGPAAARTLRLAAVAGERFDLALLLSTSSLGGPEAEEAVDAATGAGLLRPAGDRFGFSHALVRDTLLDTMTEPQRRRAHASIAATLSPDADVAERAYHLVRGRPFTEASAALAATVAAAEQAVQRLSYEDGAVWLERALDVLAAEPGLEHGGLRRQVLQVRLGEAYALAGRSPLAQQHLIAAIDTALDRRDPGAAAQAAAVLNGTGGTWFWVRYGEYPQELIDRLEAALALVDEADAASRVRLLAGLAITGYYGPDWGRIDDASAEAVRLAFAAAPLREADRRVRIEAVTARLYVIWREDRLDEQLRQTDRLLALATQPGSEAAAVFARIRRAVIAATQAQLDAAAEEQREAARLADRARLALFQAQLARLDAGHATAAGRFAEAEAAIQHGSTIMQRLQTFGYQEIDVLLLAFVRMAQGRLPEFVAALPASDHPVVADPLLVATTRLQSGDRAGAATVMRERNGFAEPPRWWDWLGRTCLQAEIAAELGDRAAAPALVERLTPLASCLAIYGTLGNFGPVAGYLGRVEWLLGRTDEAERHLRQAVALASRHQLAPFLARYSYHLGRLLSATGRPADARDHLDRASRLSLELGLTAAMVDGSA
jgi:DNA-binding SARP family transcriptional activator